MSMIKKIASSVRYQVAVMVMGVSIVSVILSQALFLLTGWPELRSAELARQVIQALVLAKNSRGAISFQDSISADETLSSLEADPTVSYSAVVVNDKVFSQYIAPGYVSLDWSQEVQRTETLMTGKFIYLVQPITLNGEEIGRIILVSSLKNLNMRMMKRGLWSVGILGIVFIFVFLMTMRFERVVSGPIIELTEIAHRISNTRDYSERVKDGYSNELGVLTQTFNSMLEQIQNRDAQLRSYSHDLENQVIERTSDLRSLNARLLHQATHDILTGLPNRKYFSEALANALSCVRLTNEKLAVLFLDLDRFKLINDTLGHAVGDELLKICSARLQHGLRNTDLVARLGGDEFTILLPVISSVASVTQVADKIVSEMTMPAIIGRHEIPFSTSIGIAIFPGHGTCVDSLMANADNAMYRAKQHGRNRWVVYSGGMSVGQSDRIKREAILRQVINQERYYPLYQPIVSLPDCKVVGFEALARLEGPDVALMRPEEFIPLIEEMGLIGVLGGGLLRKVCVHKQQWNQMGYDLKRIAVNWSPKQLNTDEQLDYVLATLKEYNLDPGEIELELTEGTLIGSFDQPVILAGMKKLEEAGFCFALDDFGTGYSSISHLRQFPIHRLKIDRSFVQEIVYNGEHANLVRGVIALARSLKMEITVEGIETRDQAQLLVSLGASEAQGFFFGKPIRFDQVADYMQSNHFICL